MTHRCIAVGQVFCGGSGADLYAALSRKSSVFLKNFHKARLEDVKAMIENERWQRIPAQTTFSVNSFREFAFLQDITDHTDDESKEAARWAEVVAVQNSITDGHSPFAVLTDDDRQFRCAWKVQVLLSNTS
ncbi:hypothetical protein SARC_03670 [Sphaeroforma arctica JP610]|uniref:Uncharacterized protein n=1 Tax=Sphaeroforma arctica JP610 TaxID=667725 RepID=A0A0L0G507_9EUKA|nr:hypothetical protein SARC_03670 [Sphaeroforma arctica JP610]KNC84105.1 hypothetical protein SARC_03670 [Sphaeroforma arctica JP610]|eukprot:XP_014158007.1 hypothetical protein SARC_03670 [Sphaeroforma arctica JP610]